MAHWELVSSFCNLKMNVESLQGLQMFKTDLLWQDSGAACCKLLHIILGDNYCVSTRPVICLLLGAKQIAELVVFVT